MTNETMCKYKEMIKEKQQASSTALYLATGPSVPASPAIDILRITPKSLRAKWWFGRRKALPVAVCGQSRPLQQGDRVAKIGSDVPS